jgi:hypothetical protein
MFFQLDSLVNVSSYIFGKYSDLSSVITGLTDASVINSTVRSIMRGPMVRLNGTSLASWSQNVTALADAMWKCNLNDSCVQIEQEKLREAVTNLFLRIPYNQSWARYAEARVVNCVWNCRLNASVFLQHHRAMIDLELRRGQALIAIRVQCPDDSCFAVTDELLGQSRMVQLAEQVERKENTVFSIFFFLKKMDKFASVFNETRLMSLVFFVLAVLVYGAIFILAFLIVGLGFLKYKTAFHEKQLVVRQRSANVQFLFLWVSH